MSKYKNTYSYRCHTKQGKQEIKRRIEFMRTQNLSNKTMPFFKSVSNQLLNGRGNLTGCQIYYINYWYNYRANTITNEKEKEIKSGLLLI